MEETRRGYSDGPSCDVPALYHRRTCRGVTKQRAHCRIAVRVRCHPFVRKSSKMPSGRVNAQVIHTRRGIRSQSCSARARCGPLLNNSFIGICGQMPAPDTCHLSIYTHTIFEAALVYSYAAYAGWCVSHLSTG